jgi:hypothetical protein
MGLRRAFEGIMPIRLVAKSRKPWNQPRDKQRENARADSLLGNKPDRHGRNSGGFASFPPISADCPPTVPSPVSAILLIRL